jgi:hypothetical protein
MEHFKCQFDGCEVSLDDKDSYLEHDDRVYCRDHFAKHFSKRVKCTKPILAQFVETNQGFWYQEFYGLNKIGERSI